MKSRSSTDVIRFEDIDEESLGVIGGKGAHLGELSKIQGVVVPDGFCVSAEVFRRAIGEAPAVRALIDRLSSLDTEDRKGIAAFSGEIRRAIDGVPIPEEIASDVARHLSGLGERDAYAVRSSATAEDLPTASFAGQQDTYLNVVGQDAVLQHISRCWASLFTDRAVTYRIQHGFDHRKVHMAVVVQRMVVPKASGVLFTADPVTGHRKVSSIEASFGLGEALVSGLVSADVYKVRDDAVVDKAVADKRTAVHAVPGGGTEVRPVDLERRKEPVLTDDQAVELACLGRRIEAHFGRPQDIEWCMAAGEFQVVQSRPITTLFPVPEATDGVHHVYISVGHQQMMTDPLKPLGISFWQLTTPRPMAEAGGRLFVDVTQALASPAGRAGILEMVGRSDPLIGDALQTILDRGDVVQAAPDENPAWTSPGSGAAPIETDPGIVARLIEDSAASLAALEREIDTKTGPALLDFILEDIQELRRILFDPSSLQAIMAGVEAAWWLNDRLYEWLGETNAADALTQSVPNNVTSEMGLALLDVADAIRPHAEVVAFLERVEGDGVENDGFLDALPALDGGREARDAIEGWLDRYGVRCVGEIDITRPRWTEHPASLLPAILGNVRNFESGEGARRFDRGRREAQRKEQEVLERLRALPDGESKAEETKQMIDRVRTFAGYREYPKYAWVSRYAGYKRAVLAEADRLVRAGVLGDKEDVFWLRFEELQDVVRTGRVDDDLIRHRKLAFRSYEALTPPRVLTSDGDAVAGSYRRDDVPEGALVGLAVSTGTVEGRARVVLDMAGADLETGDILVTAFTDPSWTPLFVTAGGLVTEVGGLMTHGAVVAREYGLPAVVGVEGATRRIRDGDRIRIHGADGYVEILP